jgi:hypothetical protein
MVSWTPVMNHFWGFYIAFNNTGEACIAGITNTGGTVVKTITACQFLQATVSKKGN